MNKHFFKLEIELSIKSILKFLKISEEMFFKYNSKNINLLDFRINKFSSLSNSSDDSLIFVNKNISNDLSDVKGVCLIKKPLREHLFKDNIVSRYTKCY